MPPSLNTERGLPMAKTNSHTQGFFNARPDSLDFRDRIYTPPLIDLPAVKPIEDYLQYEVPVLDQVDEGACIGYCLATMIHYLLRSRKSGLDTSQVSVGMLYEMARRYDEWPGRNYLGSSARGAMKGWYKHGVCEEGFWVQNSWGKSWGYKVVPNSVTTTGWQTDKMSGWDGWACLFCFQARSRQQRERYLVRQSG